MKPNWFVALPVPAESWLDAVLTDLPEDCRAFDAADVHMTVAFLGAMDPLLVDDVVAVMDRIQVAPFDIRLGSVVGLPSRKRPSALSFSLTTGRETAAAVISDWRDPLIAAGQGRPDTREPLPHITIARPNRRAGADGRREALAWADRVMPPERALRIDRIALYTWAEDRRVRQFRIVEERPFRA